jgi:Glycyl-tRNA synthetase, beta subunit
MEAGEEHAALELLAELREPINRFFDAVMVMADDAAVRDNRLALLAGIADMTSAFADFRKLVL